MFPHTLDCGVSELREGWRLTSPYGQGSTVMSNEPMLEYWSA